MVVADKEKSFKKIFIKNFIGGVGWAAGITFGFALFSLVLSFVLNQLGGLPLVGDFFASIIEATQKALDSNIRTTR